MAILVSSSQQSNMQHCRKKNSNSPANPGPITPLDRCTKAVIRAVWEELKEAHYTFDRALITRVIATVKPPYMAAI